MNEVTPTPGSTPGGTPGGLPGLVRLTHIIYALHAFSIVVGVVGVATVVGAFLVGWPSLLAVILNYIKRPDVRGTYLESHFRWQIRTFWFGALWALALWLIVIFTLGIGLVIVWLPLLVLGVWFAYRVLRGWLALNEKRPMYVAA
jgi:uncharacterized membrane protein